MSENQKTFVLESEAVHSDDKDSLKYVLLCDEESGTYDISIRFHNPNNMYSKFFFLEFMESITPQKFQDLLLAQLQNCVESLKFTVALSDCNVSQWNANIPFNDNIKGFMNGKHLVYTPLHVAPKFLVGKEAVVQHFEDDYIDTNGSKLDLSNTLIKFTRLWNSSEFYAPFLAMVQSSGCGKSKLVFEMTTDVLVLYVCFRAEGEVAYPHKSLYMNKYTSSTETKDYVHLLIGLMQHATANENVRNNAYTKYFKDMNLGELESSTRDSEWNKVRKYIEDSKTDSLNSKVSLETQLNTALQALIKVVDDTKTHLGQLKVLFVFDEASRLCEGDAKPFQALQRALSKLPDKQESRAFAIVIDTTYKTSNFSPKAGLRSSARVVSGGCNLFPPFYCLSTFDIYNKESPNTPSDCLLQKYITTLGRPLWKAYAEDRGAVEFAASKLVMARHRHWKDSLAKADCKDIEYIAVLNCRVGLLIMPRSHLTSTLVAHHMAACVHISDDRQVVAIDTPCEPLLALGAALLMQPDDDENCVAMNRAWTTMIGPLIDYLMDGAVEGGFRGELVFRIIAMQAVDSAMMCLRRRRSDALSKGNFESTPSLRIGAFLRLLDFMKHLLCRSAYKKWCEDCAQLRHAWMNLNHFVQISDNLTLKMLKEGFQRGAGFICKRNQRGIDIVFPLYLGDLDASFDDAKFSVLVVQIKNLQMSKDAAKEDNSTWKMSLDYLKLSTLISEHYMSLYVAFDNESGRFERQSEYSRTNPKQSAFVCTGWDSLKISAAAAYENYDEEMRDSYSDLKELLQLTLETEMNPYRLFKKTKSYSLDKAVFDKHIGNIRQPYMPDGEFNELLKRSNENQKTIDGVKKSGRLLKRYGEEAWKPSKRSRFESDVE